MEAMEVTEVTEAMEVTVNGEDMESSETKIKKTSKNKYALKRINRKFMFALIVLVIIVVIIFINLSQDPRKQTTINDCIQNQTVESDIFAYLNGDIQLCELQNDAFNCTLNYYVFEFFKGNYFDDCNNVDNHVAKVICQSKKNNDVDKCEEFQNQTDFDLVCKILINNDISICESVTGKQSISCKNIFYIKNGLETGDINVCENMLEIEDNSSKITWFSSKKQWCRFIIKEDQEFYNNKISEGCIDSYTGFFE